LHRPSNIQNEKVLYKIIDFLLNDWENKTDYVIWPIHPGVYKKLNDLNLLNLLINSKHIILLNPVEYFEMLNLIKNATFVLTDSGGLQEETSILGIPCLTMRENTERPVTLIENGGTNILVGHDIVKINKECQSAIKKNTLKKEIAYWDGFAASRAINHLLNYI
jgi:UDP-N-acetylglucosamine 2-epimerase (non-hydrolysing)